MKTQKQKTEDEIKSIELNIRQSIKERDVFYNQLKDFKLSSNKTDVILKKNGRPYVCDKVW